MNHRLTFKSNKRRHITVSKFYLIAATGFLLNAVVMWLNTTVIGMHYILSQIIATGIVLVWNFLGNRYWTFR